MNGGAPMTSPNRWVVASRAIARSVPRYRAASTPLSVSLGVLEPTARRQPLAARAGSPWPRRGSVRITQGTSRRLRLFATTQIACSFAPLAGRAAQRRNGAPLLVAGKKIHPPVHARGPYDASV